jgi:hypothetical protein
MHQTLWSRLAFLTTSALLVVAVPVQAMMPAPAPIADRVLGADCVFVGKVRAVEDKTVSALPNPSATAKVDFTVVTVDVEDGLIAPKGLTRLRLGFPTPPPPPPPPAPGPGPVKISKGYRGVTFAAGQEGVFLLKKHPDEDFYVAASYYSLLNKKSPSYDKDLEAVRLCVKLLDGGAEGLKAKDASERLLTAYLLLGRFRAGQTKDAKKEPIDAAESKALLETLANADWTTKDPATGASALGAFSKLGLTEKDGWKPGPFKDPTELPTAAKKWLKEHADTYRIQRTVAEKTDKK